MVPHSEAVGDIHDCVAVEHELGVHVEIAAVGQIDCLEVIGVDDDDIIVGIVAVKRRLGGEPAAVGGPLEREPAVAVGEVRAVGYLFDAFRGKIHEHDLVAVFDKQHFCRRG